MPNKRRHKAESPEAGATAPESSSDTQALLQFLIQQQQQMALQHQQQLDQQQAIFQQIAQSLSQQPQLHSSSNQAGTPTPSPQSSHPPAVKSLPVPRLSSPENLTIPQFRDWRQRWDDYFNATQLSKHPIDTQQGILRSALDQEWTMLWTSSRLPITPTTTVKEIIVLMEEYIRRRRNPLLDRQEFHRRDQMPGESADRYYAALKTLDDACAHEYDIVCPTCLTECKATCANPACAQDLSLLKQLQETRIRDRLICGLNDKETQRKILAEQYSSVLTLDRVLAICSAMEQSNAAGASLGSSRPPQAVSALKKKSTYKKQQGNTASQTPSRKAPLKTLLPPDTCWGCGQTPRHPQDQCKALTNKCECCGRTGHYKRVCGKFLRESNQSSPQQPKQKDRNKPNSPSTNSAIVTRKLELLPIKTNAAESPYIIKWLCDTGAEIDAISVTTLQELGGAALYNISSEVEDATATNGMSLGPVGSLPAVLELNGKTYTTTIGVYTNVHVPLLSKRGCISLGLIDADWPHSAASKPGIQAISCVAPSIAPPVKPSLIAVDQIKKDIITEFPSVFNDDTLQPMNGSPMRIQLIEGATPCKRYKAHSVPYHWRDPVKQQLDTMVSKGIIEPVPVGEPIDWCHPMVVVPKKGSHEPRITVDLTGLNKFVRRPAYPVRIPREVVARIPPGNKYFTTLDARHGYWQVPLDDESKKLTTFITQWGCFRYCRNVMGLISAGDEHNRRGDEALRGIENVEKIVEDIIIFDQDLDTHTQRVKQVIQRCQENNITLNAKKFVFAQPEVDWCGYHISQTGYTTAPHIVTAIVNFPTPTSKTDVRSFNGLVQQFEAFSHKITELAAPLRALLPAKAAFVWESPHERAFKEIIAELSSPRVLTHFVPGLPLRLETDAAQSKGLGFALFQQQPDQQWKVLQVGSRFVTPTESRYSATEVELLAVVWAVRKCKLYLLGQHFELIVDHRPLISIINSKTLDEIDNPRIQRLKEKLALFRPHAVWRAGTKHTVVDVFSRFPSSDPSLEDLTNNLDSDTPQLCAVTLNDPEDGSPIFSDLTLQGIKDAADSSVEYQSLIHHIQHGFPEKTKLEDYLQPYWKYHSDLSTEEGLIFLGSRIVIPQILRPHILQILHSSHQGQDRTLRRARQAVFWPGITNDIRNVVRVCKSCQAYLPSICKEPLQSDHAPTYPFQSVSSDLFSYAGYEYLVMMDRYTGWPLIAKTGTSTTTANIIRLMSQWMADYGIPETLVSDNGPQFSSLEFKTWTNQWGIQHKTSSPHYPQSNGHAEAAVKSLKYLLAKTSPTGDIKNEAFQLGLLELRNTPRADGRSPAQILFGSPTRSQLPLHRSRFHEDWKKRSAAADEKAKTLREKAIARYNENAHVLDPFVPGDIVLVQDHKTRRFTLLAEVLSSDRQRSYTLRTEAGRLLRRNRRFLYRYFACDPPLQPTESQPETPLRRSTRTRRPPQRWTGSVQCDTGSHLEGGHVMGCGRLPQYPNLALRSKRAKAETE